MYAVLRWGLCSKIWITKKAVYDIYFQLQKKDWKSANIWTNGICEKKEVITTEFSMNIFFVGKKLNQGLDAKAPTSSKSYQSSKPSSPSKLKSI